jgi:hypothetical protein
LWFSRLACNVSQPVSLYKLLIDTNRVPPVRLWNSEPTSLRDSKSPSSLKSYYKSKCIKKPIYYYSVTRIGQILHMRLWTACNSLRLACNVSQPVSLYKLLIDTNRVPPVTILAASIWTFSNLFIKNNVLLSHTTSAYSKIGRMKVR